MHTPGALGYNRPTHNERYLIEENLHSQSEFMCPPPSNRPPSRKCDVCDAENMSYRSKCIQCNAKLDKKKLQSQRSKASKGKDKYKRKLPECNGNKRVYRSRKDALSSSRAMFEKGIGLRSYWCKTCSGYHLTKLRQRG